MYQKDKVLNCFSELVGFHESYSSDDQQLTTSLYTSDSGFYVNDLPAITYNLMQSTLELSELDLATYLQKVYDSSVLSILNQFVQGLKDTLQSKEILANETLFSGFSDETELSTPAARFVGYMIKPRISNALFTVIKSVSLQLEVSQTLRIFLYDTSQKTAIKTYDFVYGTSFSEVWKDVTDFLISYQKIDGGAGKTYLIGYYEETSHPQTWQLTSRAYSVDFNSCDCFQRHTLWQRWMNVQPIAFPESKLNWNGTTYDLPDIKDIETNISQYSFGLNLKVNTTCDITQVLCHNRFSFAEALQLTIAMRILADARASSRFNSIAEVKRNQVQEYWNEYKKKLEGAYMGVGDNVVYNKGILKTIEIDFSDLDRVCLKRREEIQTIRKQRSGY